jgi:hypothetical protein
MLPVQTTRMLNDFIVSQTVVNSIDHLLEHTFNSMFSYTCRQGCLLTYSKYYWIILQFEFTVETKRTLAMSIP